MSVCNRVLLAIYRGEEPPTKKNSVVSTLCKADVVKVTERTPQGTAKKLELTESGRVWVKRHLVGDATIVPKAILSHTWKRRPTGPGDSKLTGSCPRCGAVSVHYKFVGRAKVCSVCGMDNDFEHSIKHVQSVVKNGGNLFPIVSWFPGLVDYINILRPVKGDSSVKRHTKSVC